MMIDLHSHILPDVDDGARSLHASLEMARIAVEGGVSAMVATPHCVDDRRWKICDAWKMLCEALEETEIPLRLLLGMEIFGTLDTASMLRDGELLTLNGSRYPLIEFSFRGDGDMETYILRSVLRAGFRPVVAHPERYAFIQHNPDLLNHWFHMGCLFQVNRGSLMGRFGGRAEMIGMELVERNFATVIASDTHAPGIRTPWMQDIRQMLTKMFSQRYANLLLEENPAHILNDEELHLAEPEWF